MRLSIRVFGVALLVGTLAASGRSDDLTLDLTTPPPPPQSAPAPAAAIGLSTLAATPPCDSPSLPACTPSPFDGDCCTRPLLLGSLCGVRDQLAAHGITINADTYQFYQGVATGGIHDVGEYSGRNDYFVNIDGEKLGLWKGFFITLHGETRYGDTVNRRHGRDHPRQHA